MHYQIALRSFGLITQVPDRVGRWFNYAGANDSQGEGEDTRAAVGIINNQFEDRGRRAAGALATGGKTGGNATKGTSGEAILQGGGNSNSKGASGDAKEK